jgi:uncharacterized protein (TIGR00266 family)
MQAEIIGSTLPVLEISLQPGDKIISETGELSWKSTNVSLHTTTATGGNSGIFGAIGRSLSGGSLFMTEYTSSGDGHVAFAAKVPGIILEETVTLSHGYMIHKHGFLCGQEGIELSTGFTKSLGAGIFGGNGFLLQKVTGKGKFWVELGGHVVVKDLQYGEAIDVHPSHVGMYEDKVNFEITVLPGFRNKLFGGDGLFMARLSGPGRIWLQTLTLPNLANCLAPYLVNPKSS